MSIRNILLERVYLFLQPTIEKTVIQDCAKIFHTTEANESDQLWALRFYVLMTECFSEWIKDSMKTKYKKLNESLQKLPKDIYFNQHTGEVIDHSVFDEMINSKRHVGMDVEINSDLKDQRNNSAYRNSNIQLSQGRNQSLQKSESRLKMFEELEQHKMTYLNCLFNNSFSYKELAINQRNYELFYQSIRREIYAYLEKSELTTNPKKQKIRKDLNFSNILAPYLAKTSEDLKSSKGLQRIRTNILGFFQAAYREYPTEYLKMIDEESPRTEGDTFKANDKEVFVIKNENLFGKGKIEKMYSKQQKEALNFSESRSVLNFDPKQKNFSTLDNKNTSKLISVQPRFSSEIDYLTSENERLRKERNELKGKLDELNQKYEKMAIVSSVNGKNVRDDKFKKYQNINKLLHKHNELGDLEGKYSNLKTKIENQTFGSVYAFKLDSDQLRHQLGPFKKISAASREMRMSNAQVVSPSFEMNQN